MSKKAIVLFSRFNGIINLIGESETDKLFRGRDECTINVFDESKAEFVGFGQNTEKKQSLIFYVCDSFEWENFEPLHEFLKDYDKIAVIHTYPDNAFVTKMEENGYCIKKSLHERNGSGGREAIYYTIYKTLWQINNGKAQKEKLSRLVEEYFQDCEVTDELNDKLELLHSLLFSPNNVDKEKKRIGKYLEDFSVAGLENLEYSDNKYQDFLEKLRDSLKLEK